MTKTSPPTTPAQIIPEMTEADIIADQVIDITRDVCPMTFVRTRLALDRLPHGAILLVQLTGEEPLRNVPRTAEAQGHTILRLTPQPNGHTHLWLRRGGGTKASKSVMTEGGIAERSESRDKTKS